MISEISKGKDRDHVLTLDKARLTTYHGIPDRLGLSVVI